MAKSDLLTASVPVSDEEKSAQALSSMPGADNAAGNASDSDVGHTLTWTAAEEQALVRKVDWIVMPILMLVFFGLQLDRANAGNALTDNFLKDVGITQNQFNIGTQLLNAGIVVLEIPSNLVLYRVGPKAWIGVQIFLWGFVATFQSFQKGLGGYLSTRLLLGLCESGFIPGSLFTISQWYRAHELSRRYAFFFLGNGLATAAGGLIAYGVLHMRGLAGLAGWQWLFILEGIFTVLTGVVFVTLFPGLPSHPVSFAGVRYFSDRELLILRQRKALDDPTAGPLRRRVAWQDLRVTLLSGKVWLHVLLTTVGLAPSTALWSYAPTIVASYGFNRLASNAMTSVGQWVSVALVVLGGFVADRWGRRGCFVLVAVAIEFVFTVAYKCLHDDAARATKFALLTLASATCSWWHAAHGSWLAINARSPAERSIRMALFIMAANCAGIVGGQLFRSDDLPYYHRGWTIAVAFMAFSVAVTLALLVLYALANRQLKKEVGGGDGVAGVDASHVDKDGQPIASPVVKLYNY
ncbi:MFS transporter [Sporothrix schenckii 1099-18]|uniref:Major facilitator superfamily (MFS) profile domain-containing protein n=2 Tax=Sporothrix schenckii TaxID=29908 RepID=U7PT20_SPOS1|nr:MFS transporter [Sporothrix schenckii 1099-18]ERS97610.1 hypothetical protein HMPREF1624_05781 [Sporothrix schenckii ATCC 58251]KJR82132.1 MFS transporter [Sporothrix schenckii 1099-18]